MENTLPNTPLVPEIPLHDKRFEYRNSAATDVTITWRKYGWLSKGELNERQDSRTTSDERNTNN